jgi:hypothetical protein
MLDSKERFAVRQAGCRGHTLTLLEILGASGASGAAAENKEKSRPRSNRATALLSATPRFTHLRTRGCKCRVDTLESIAK